MTKSNIALAHSLYAPAIIGGAEISTQILAETLGQEYAVKVLTVGEHNEKKIVNDRINGVNVMRLPYSNIYWYGDTSAAKSTLKKVQWRLIDIYNTKQYHFAKQILRENEIKLLHTQNLPGLSLSLWKAACDLNIPIVHTLRDFSLLDPIGIKSYALLYSIIARNFSHNVSAVVGISNDVLKTHLQQGFFKHAKSYVVSNVVESDDFSDSLYEQKKHRAMSPSLKIGCFGQLMSIKGLDYLIRAVKELEKKVVVELRIVGDGPELKTLMQLADGDERIQFLGKRSRMQTLEEMSGVDVTFVPSIWKEPFGRVIIESYLVGTPVFGSRIGGIPEVMYKPEQFCFEPGDVAAIRESILAFFNFSPERRKALSAEVKTYSENFNTGMLLSRHRDIYNEILA